MFFLPRSFRALVVALVMTVLSGGPVAAMGDCKVLVDENEFRGCTFTEEVGQCLTWALDSYDECVENVDGWGDRLVCELAVQADLFACNLEMAGDLLRMISPFA